MLRSQRALAAAALCAVALHRMQPWRRGARRGRPRSRRRRDRAAAGYRNVSLPRRANHAAPAVDALDPAVGHGRRGLRERGPARRAGQLLAKLDDSTLRPARPAERARRRRPGAAERPDASGRTSRRRRRNRPSLRPSSNSRPRATTSQTAQAALVNAKLVYDRTNALQARLRRANLSRIARARRTSGPAGRQQRAGSRAPSRRRARERAARRARTRCRSRTRRSLGVRDAQIRAGRK